MLNRTGANLEKSVVKKAITRHIYRIIYVSVLFCHAFHTCKLWTTGTGVMGDVTGPFPS